MLEHGSESDIKDIEKARTSTGLSVLSLAVMMKRWNLVKILSNKYPKLINVEDRESLTPLTRTILMSEFPTSTHMIDILKENLYHINRKGYNVLHLAIMQKNVEVINYLISVKFDPHREEYYDEHDACDFIVKFGMFHNFKDRYFTKNCRLYNKKMRKKCPIVPTHDPDDGIDEKYYNDKSDREKLLMNISKLDIALNKSVLI